MSFQVGDFIRYGHSQRYQRGYAIVIKTDERYFYVHWLSYNDKGGDELVNMNYLFDRFDNYPPHEWKRLE